MFGQWWAEVEYFQLQYEKKSPGIKSSFSLFIFSIYLHFHIFVQLAFYEEGVFLFQSWPGLSRVHNF